MVHNGLITPEEAKDHPQQNVIKAGTKVLLNGASGVVIDNGTRSTPEKPNLLLTADMKQMNKYYLAIIFVLQVFDFQLIYNNLYHLIN